MASFPLRIHVISCNNGAIGIQAFFIFIFFSISQVIAKDRFAKKSSAVETLKSEVAILQAVEHHGIIKLESMFETKDKIFVVMEKMNGDMLELILSQVGVSEELLVIVGGKHFLIRQLDV